MRAAFPLAGALLAALAAGAGAQEGRAAPPAAPQRGWIELPLRDALARLAPGERVAAYAVLGARPDYEALGVELAAIPRGARGRALCARLRERDASARGGVVAALDEFVADGSAAAIREIYVANVVAFRGDAVVAARVAALPGVARVALDGPVAVDTADAPAASSAAAGPRGAAVAAAPAPAIVAAPHLLKIGAVDCWYFGTAGQGVTVCLIDDGTAHDHPCLKNHIWQNPGEIPGNGIDDDGNGHVDDVRGWNFANDSPDTYGTGHGTQTAGLLVGDGSLADAVGNQYVTGVAPDAKLMITVLGSTPSSYWACQQYALENGADVVSSSHSFKWTVGSQPDFALFRAMTDAELAAGVLHVNSAGNQGGDPNFPIPYNIGAPANAPAPWRHTIQLPGGLSAALAVAATTMADAPFSLGSRGPCAWEDVKLVDPTYPHPQDPAKFDYPYAGGTKPGLPKPDLTAPTGVLTTAGASSYFGNFLGTSASAPQVAGAAALMLAENGRLEPRHLAHLLQATALDLGAPGKDSILGAGRLRAFDAVKRAQISVHAVPPIAHLGGPAAIECHALPGKPTYLLAGLFPVPTPVPGVGTIDLGPPMDFVFDGLVPAAPNFTAASFTIPNAPVLAGLTIHFQMGSDDTAGPTGGWVISALEPLAIAP